MGSMGAPSAAQIALYTDARAKVFEAAYPLLGLGQPGETATLAALEVTALMTVLGDSTSAHPGLGHPLWQQMIADALNSAAGGIRTDAWFARQSLLMRTLDDLVQANLPPGWRFSAPRPFDAHLTRLNGAFGAPSTPGAAGILTATQSAVGALPSVVAASAPRLVHTLVGASDEYESLPTGEATQVGLAGINNAYSYQIAGTVPSGVTKVRTYRSFFGAGGAPYFWDQDTPVIGGAAYPAILIVQPDAQLRQDWQPPAWMQCPLRPAAACLFALAYATAVLSGPAGPPLAFNVNGMISPGNVILNYGFAGIGNPPQTAQFGSSVLTAANTASFVQSAIQTVSNPVRDVQGFAGAMGLRVRCFAALNGTLTPTVNYTYYDVAHGWGNAQTASGITPTTAFSGAQPGDTLLFALPTGQVIQSVSEIAVSGSATIGSWVYEGVFPR